VLNLDRQPHRRYNALTCEWVLVSPQRTERPWQGQIEKTKTEIPEYDANCYLCPGNERAGGHRNPAYASTFIFDNDFAALRPETPADRYEEGLLVAEGEPGICRVLCFSPRHDLTIARMNLTEIRKVVEAWVAQYLDLGALSFVNWVQIFENRGDLMGASSPHPHCQVWANLNPPNELCKESNSQTKYYVEKEKCLLCDYLGLEMNAGERLVCANESFQAVVPFWAIWPFETIIVCKRHVTGLDELTAGERGHLADILKRITIRYDNLFQTSFPYTMGFHQRPTDGEAHPEWHLHAHFYPPLLRSATVRKFMVGYELLASPQRDLNAEEAAEKLRRLSELHYRQEKS
jgi:UDPglucose--hexose-1-phosphate uridylyltransferase